MEEGIDKEMVFDYLDNLRESGAVNMFGAAPWVERAFDVDRETALAMLSEWMQTYGERHPK